MEQPHQKPTVVLCHGAWHKPLHYESLFVRLRQKGFNTYCPALPTANGAIPPTSTFAQDVEVTRNLVESLVDEGREVLVIMHSYGGVVGANALDAAMSAKQRREQSLQGGVIGLIYMCAFLLLPGDQAGSARHPDFQDPITMAANGTAIVKDPKKVFYQDVDDEVAASCIDELVPHSITAFGHEITGAPCKVIPTTYFYCTEDRMISFSWQQEHVRMTRGKGVEIHEETFASGHSPFLSMTDEVVAAVQRAWVRSGGRALE